MLRTQYYRYRHNDLTRLLVTAGLWFSGLVACMILMREYTASWEGTLVEVRITKDSDGDTREYFVRDHDALVRNPPGWFSRSTRERGSFVYKPAFDFWVERGGDNHEQLGHGFLSLCIWMLGGPLAIALARRMLAQLNERISIDRRAGVLLHEPGPELYALAGIHAAVQFAGDSEGGAYSVQLTVPGREEPIIAGSFNLQSDAQDVCAEISAFLANPAELQVVDQAPVKGEEFRPVSRAQPRAVTVQDGAECHVCGAGFEGTAVACPRCDTPHHGDCWDYFGGCATYGCGARTN